MRYSIHTLPQVATHPVPVLRGQNPDTATGLGLIMAGRAEEVPLSRPRKPATSPMSLSCRDALERNRAALGRGRAGGTEAAS